MPSVPQRTLPFDPIDEAARHWSLRWDGVAAMRAVTSLMRVQQLLIGHLDEVLRPHGLTFARYETLVLLSFSRHGALPLGKMGQRLQVHPTSVTSIVNRLEASGHLRREPHPSDGRTVMAALTDVGRAAVEAATADLVAGGFGLDALDEDALAQITHLLRPVRRAAGDFA